jgi:dTDP-4-dehydrorhamnose 3,5-epimerase
MLEPILIKIKRFEDNRGIFYESYKDEILEKEYGITKKFVQDNHSISKINVIRGLHYQWNNQMDKVVRVSKGLIIDKIVDIRKDSPNYGKVYSYELSEYNSFQLWIPAGFAHGFISLEQDSHVQYKCTEHYNKDGESGINPLDISLNIDWGAKTPILSEKDLNSKSFIEYNNDPKF